MKIKLGKYELEKPIALAPMEDVTDLGFRLICKEFGADIVYTEFISSDGLIRSARKSLAKLANREQERPIGIQIFGGDPNVMAEAAKIAEDACRISSTSTQAAGYPKWHSEEPREDF